MKQITKILITIITILLIQLNFVTALSISINPASLYDANMVRGGYTERTIRIGTKEESALIRVFYGNKSSPINEWIKLTPGEMEFNISKDNPRNIKISVQLPNDVPNGNYNTKLIFFYSY